MDSTDLTPEQKAKLRQQVERQLRFVEKLCGRLAALNFPADDLLVRESSRARITLSALYRAVRTAGMHRK